MGEVVVKMENIVKRFPRVLANDHVNLEVERGEIHCLLGENGAGKTTLMNILSGLYSYNSGRIFIRGEEVFFKSPSDSIAKGIGMVHQHFMLIPVFSVTENLILGCEPVKGVALDIKKAERDLRELAENYGFSIDPKALVHDVSVGMQQRIEILKLLYRGADIMIFDEPTAILTPQEVEELYGIMRSLKDKGHTLIFITHKLREVMDISDRVTVLRDGRVVDTVETASTSPEELAEMMVGRKVLFRVEKEERKRGRLVLKVENVYARNQRGLPALRGLSFEVHEGEIVGIAGVDGNGQTELVEVLTGLRKLDRGRVIFEGRDMKNLGPGAFLKSGIAHIPEDRQLRGLILDFPLYENMILGFQDSKPFARGLILDFELAKRFSNRLIEEFDIRAYDSNVLASTLSGGNQQKVIIARELQRNPKLLIAAQPTRGLDVGATEFVHRQIVKERDAGRAVLLVSLELSEILDLSDRILVIYEGKIVAEFDPRRVTKTDLGLAMAGGKKIE